MVHAVLLFSGILLFATTANAESDYKRINTALVEEVLIPAYSRLSQETEHQERLWTNLCAGTNVIKVDAVRRAFHQTSDAWAAVFNWDVGPMTLLLRRDRFYHWPERRNAIDKGLTKLLSAQDQRKLEPSVFAGASVAVQGLPALERLLYGPSDVTQDDWACRVGQAIVRNLNAIAQGAVNEWRDDVFGFIQRGEPHPIYFGDPRETSNSFFTGLLTGYAIIKDQKLLPVLGESAQKAKPNLTEGRRSGRFLRNLRLNMEGLFRVDQVFATHLPPDAAVTLAADKEDLLRSLEQLEPLETSVYDPVQRDRYAGVIRNLTSYRASIIQLFTTHLGVKVGFNSLDGD